MKYYLIAGERSGDLHGANLMRAIQELDNAAEFRFFGGEAMQKVGGELVVHYKEMAFMGFVDVLLNLRKIARFLKKCQKDLLQFQPDVLILIDYAGFNMRMAAFAKKNNIRTFYYISPKVWAWNTKRAIKIKENVEALFTILPFETAFFEKFAYKVHYVGNPLLDEVVKFQPQTSFLAIHNLPENIPLIALLPGSRKHEVKRLLPEMLKVCQFFPEYQFVIAGVSQLPDELYKIPAEVSNVSVIFDNTYNVLAEATAAIVTSGTATLETALFDVPQIVVYKSDPISYSIVIRLVRVPYFSLVNLIAEKSVVTELLQHQVNTPTLVAELKKILPANPLREQMLEEYAGMRAKLGEAGASQRAGKLMVKMLQGHKKTSQ